MPTVNDILSRKGRDIVSLAADETVLSAARLMNEKGIGGIVVTDGGQVVGIFTERDILRRVVAEQRDPGSTLLRDVMTSPVMRCTADAKLDECMRVMTEKRLRHMPVEDGADVVGIVTSGDILAFRVVEQQDTIEHLNRYVFDLR